MYHKKGSVQDTDQIYSSCFKISEAEHASVASRSGCSRVKSTAHTSSDITRKVRKGEEKFFKNFY
ncbi:MAG: hypothetical protein LBJ00_05830 [Planctomycetaceae bacterium]|nr:hypothetical protein [Planctomycetaceae bacterium]